MLGPKGVAARTVLIVLAAVAAGSAGTLLADSPFATEVVDYVEGTGVGFDWISGDPFNDSTTALGRPTVDTTGDNWSIPLEENVPVVPVYPAFRAFELVTIGYDGYLILMFDHPVENHPRNPYGLDFIVFGNAFQVMGGGQSWTNRDPNEVTVQTNQIFREPGRVSVSKDGETWYTYEDGPYADDFAPTLGRVYDPENPDHGVGEWNEWWGHPTDPTLPLNPELTADSFVGKTVAEIAVLYDGSAGGTAFDIGIFGLDWIQYVRIDNTGDGTPEIDAVADVSPVHASPAPPESLEPTDVRPCSP